MNSKLLNTALGGVLGGTLAAAVHAVYLAQDLTAPISYPVRGAIGGAFFGIGMSQEYTLSVAQMGALITISAAAGCAVNVCAIPFAPVIGFVNLVTTPFTIAGCTVGGAVIGYKSK